MEICLVSNRQKFRESISPNPVTKCWHWMRGESHGYGVISQSKSAIEKASRFSYRLYNGPIEPGLHVLHRCDRPTCVNPDHLFLGTPADNADDRQAKGRGKQGHVYGENHPNHRLTASQVIAVRKLAAEGLQHWAIAGRFGVARSTISRIVKGDTRRIETEGI